MSSNQHRKLAPLFHKSSDAVLIFTAVSFAGWCFEKIGRLLLYHSTADRGFLSMPLCPIYGTCILLIGGCLGSPTAPSPLLQRLLDRCRGLPRWIRRLLCGILYFLAATLLSTAIELAVGIPFRALGIPLWDYSERLGNLWGVVCPSFSLLWGALITGTMSLIWAPLCRLFARIPKRIKHPLALITVSLILLDFLANCIFVLITGERFLVL